MIEQIQIALINESGEFVPMKATNGKVEMKAEIVTAEIFTEIAQIINAIKDDEIRLAEKFNLAKNLKNYLEEINDADRTGN